MDFPHRRTVDEQVARAEAEGWRYDGSMRTEGEVLDLIYALVCVEKPEVCVETGTYQAHGTEAISRAIDSNGKGHLWTVEQDPIFEYAPHKNVTFIQADSVEWSANEAPDGIDFAFVDCGEPAVRIEVFKNLLPKMKPGKLILVHDTVFHDDPFIEALRDAAYMNGGDQMLHLPALNGLAVWRIG